MANEYARFWWVLSVDAGGATAKAVLFAIAVRMNRETRTTFPSTSTLAADLGCDEKTIRLTLRALAERGLIVVTKRPGRSDVYGFPAEAFALDDSAGIMPARALRPRAECPDSAGITPDQRGHSARRTAEGTANLYSKEQEQHATAAAGVADDAPAAATNSLCLIRTAPEPKIPNPISGLWNEPELPEPIRSWANHHAARSLSPSPLKQAEVVANQVGVDAEWVESMFRLAPERIVMKCCALVCYDVSRMRKAKNPGAIAAKRWREKILSCRTHAG